MLNAVVTNFIPITGETEGLDHSAFQCCISGIWFDLFTFTLTYSGDGRLRNLREFIFLGLSIYLSGVVPHPTDARRRRGKKPAPSGADGTRVLLPEETFQVPSL